MKRWIHSTTNDGNKLASDIESMLLSEGIEPEDCYFDPDYDGENDAVTLVTYGDHRNVCDRAYDLVVQKFNPDESNYHEVGDSYGDDSCTCIYTFIWHRD